MLQTAAERLAEVQAGLDTPLLARLMGLVGIATMLAIAFLMSNNKKRIDWRLVGMGLALQAAFGFIVLKTQAGQALFRWIGTLVTGLLNFSAQGGKFIFGNLINNLVPVGPVANGAVDASAGVVANVGASFAFYVLPVIIFFSSLMSVLYYLNVMQCIVKGMAWAVQKTLGTSGAETLSASGNIFMGQTEAPLLIKPFIKTMTRSEINTVMVGGFAFGSGVGRSSRCRALRTA